MTRALALVAALGGGCNLVFGLEAPAGDDATGDDGGGTDGRLDDGGGECSVTADEDGDGVADDCDVCPHRFDVGQDDDDGDRVGNLCDPDPGGTNRIVFFDGFNAAGMPGWLQLAGTWQQADGFAYQLDAEQLATHLVRDGVVPATALVDAALIAGPFATAAPDPYRGAALFFQASPVVTGLAPDGFECQWSTSTVDSTSGIYLQRWTEGLAQILSSAPVNDLFEANGRYNLVATSDGNQLACGAGFDQPDPFARISAAAPSPPGTAVGLRTRYTAARWAWVIVIERPTSD